MSTCPYAVPGDAGDVELEWWEELCLKYGMDPTPPPDVHFAGPDGVVVVPPVEFPFPEPLTTERVARIFDVPQELLEDGRPPVATYDERPPRRPYLDVNAFSDTQTMPVIREP